MSLGASRFVKSLAFLLLGILGIITLGSRRLGSTSAAQALSDQIRPSSQLAAHNPDLSRINPGAVSVSNQLAINLPITITIDQQEVLTPPKDTICSQIWGAYPEQTIIPLWLSTPDSPAGLFTDIPYTLLAGKLIQAGLVSAADCPAKGMLPNGAASTCGVEKARAVVTLWQNQFDQTIWEVAVRNAIPAVLLKHLLAQENQFWFGASVDYTHFGSGQITQAGLDPLFIWYPYYYNEVCPLVFYSETCNTRYSELTLRDQAMIRGYFLATRIEAGCPTCPLGIDLPKAHQSIDIIAKLVVANCQQANRIIYNTTESMAGSLSNYEDLWRITVANYNAGSGCISDAIANAYKAYSFLNWSNVAGQLSSDCEKVIDYVDVICR